ncbi:MAG: RluA family pseudouridine synthase [Acutalibacteraceae bacterium]
MKNTICKNEIQIIYEDSDILVINKPVGVPSEDTPKGEKGVISYLLNDDRKVLHLLHRLDREVSGVMVFAKNKKSASALSTAIQNKHFQKRYLAVTDGIPGEETGIYRDLLFKDSKRNRSYVVDRVRKGVKEASLEYQVKCVKDNKALVEILLHTGRTHQIRVQFSSRKTPLLCDSRYGSKDRGGSLALHSHKITFIHPVSNDTVEFSCEPNYNDYPWNIFSNQVGT